MRTKRAFKIKYKTIFTIFEGPSLKRTKKFFLEGESPTLRLIPNFMTSQAGQQIITIYILPNISRTRDHRAMKFGQLIEYNVRNIFYQKPCGK